MLKNLLPLELTDGADGGLAEIRIGKEIFNGYPGKVSVPDWAEVSEDRTAGSDCVSRKFTLKLKEGFSYRSWNCSSAPPSYDSAKPLVDVDPCLPALRRVFLQGLECQF